MSPLLNVPTSGTLTSGTTTKFTALVNVASRIHENMNVSEIQEHQEQHKSNDAVVDCSSTKDRTISDFSVKVASVSETGIADAGKKKYQCSQCSRAYQSLPNLKRHTKNTHSAPQIKKCPDCERSFKYKASLDEHMFREHGNRDTVKGYKCNQCERIFASSRGLKRHAETVHVTKPRETCHDCKKTFKHKESLETHRRIEHSDDGKPHKCNQCDQAFAHISRLKQHETTHTGKCNYECPVCHNAYSSVSSLNRHKSTKHDGKEKKFICIQCGSSFFYADNLRRHRLTHENKSIKAHECQTCHKQLPCLTSLIEHQKLCHGIDYCIEIRAL